jgi:hypothetical protein
MGKSEIEEKLNFFFSSYEVSSIRTLFNLGFNEYGIDNNLFTLYNNSLSIPSQISTVADFYHFLIYNHLQSTNKNSLLKKKYTKIYHFPQCKENKEKDLLVEFLQDYQIENGMSLPSFFGIICSSFVCPKRCIFLQLEAFVLLEYSSFKSGQPIYLSEITQEKFKKHSIEGICQVCKEKCTIYCEEKILKLPPYLAIYFVNDDKISSVFPLKISLGNTDSKLESFLVYSNGKYSSFKICENFLEIQRENDQTITQPLDCSQYSTSNNYFLLYSTGSSLQNLNYSSKILDLDLLVGVHSQKQKIVSNKRGNNLFKDCIATLSKKKFFKESFSQFIGDSQKLLFQIENISTKQDLEKEIGKVVENTVKSSIIFGSENKDYGVFPGLPNHKHLENNQICSSGNIY